MKSLHEILQGIEALHEKTTNNRCTLCLLCAIFPLLMQRLFFIYNVGYLIPLLW